MTAAHGSHFHDQFIDSLHTLVSVVGAYIVVLYLQDTGVIRQWAELRTEDVAHGLVLLCGEEDNLQCAGHPHLHQCRDVRVIIPTKHLPLFGIPRLLVKREQLLGNEVRRLLRIARS